MAIVSGIVGLMVMKGLLTSQQAQDVNQQTQLIAGSAVTIVSCLSYAMTRFGTKRAYFKSLAPDPIYQAPTQTPTQPYNAPSSPSYAPISTGDTTPNDAPWLLASV